VRLKRADNRIETLHELKSTTNKRSEVKGTQTKLLGSKRLWRTPNPSGTMHDELPPVTACLDEPLGVVTNFKLFLKIRASSFLFFFQASIAVFCSFVVLGLVARKL
jgi:hypothetical protein